MSPSVSKAAPSTSATLPVISRDDIIPKSTTVSRKRSAPLSSTGSSSSTKRPCTDDALGTFLSSKRTVPQVFSGKTKTPVAPVHVVPSHLAQTDDDFKVLSTSRFPRALFKHSSTTWQQHYTALLEKENDIKLEKLIEKSKATTIKKVAPVLHPTMALRDQLKAQRLQEAQLAKKNGPEEVKPKKKAMRRQRNTWN